MKTVPLLFGLALLLAAAVPESTDLEQRITPDTVVIDDFQKAEVGKTPSNWKFVTGRQELRPASDILDEDGMFTVYREGGRQFLRARTAGRAIRISLLNERDFDWKLDKHPELQWEWRANKLPRNAREDVRSLNDVAAAVYVTFGSDWLGRPVSIKYTYSTTLPVGTVLSQGPLRVMVISSGKDGKTGDWKTHRRNLIDDYRQVFGSAPPNDPISITVWSDSDTIANARSEADFDNIRLMPSRR